VLDYVTLKGYVSDSNHKWVRNLVRDSHQPRTHFS
jgi:hypothetical protein